MVVFKYINNLRSVNLTAVKEMFGNCQKVRKVPTKNVVRENCLLLTCCWELSPDLIALCMHVYWTLQYNLVSCRLGRSDEKMTGNFTGHHAVIVGIW